MLRIQSRFDEALEGLVKEVVDCGFAVHTGLGPGFREKIYERAFCLELHSRGIPFECEKRIEVKYRHWTIPGQKVDLLVAGSVLVEIKSVPALAAVHRKQVLSYLKTLDLRIGLLMNFNVALYKHGVRRVVN